MAFELPDLPFDQDALEPHISARTIKYHYGKHHKGYVDKLNKAIEGTKWEKKSLEEIIVANAGEDGDSDLFNNAAQHWNHTFFWDSLSPEHQAVITQAMQEMGPLNRQVMDVADAEARSKAQADFGVTFIEPPMDPWIAKMAPAHADFESRGLVEAGLISKIQAIE